jgi:hypothetical protein
MHFDVTRCLQYVYLHADGVRLPGCACLSFVWFFSDHRTRALYATAQNEGFQIWRRAADAAWHMAKVEKQL